MTAKRLIYLLLPLLWACTGSGEDDPWQGETAETEVTVGLDAVWEVDASRAAPPGTGSAADVGGVGQGPHTGEEEIAEIDHVHIFTFRREETSTDPEFYYDSFNSPEAALDATVNYPTGDELAGHDNHNHKAHTFRITKRYGYEYRIVALAYNKAAFDAQTRLNNTEDTLKFRNFRISFVSTQATNSQYDGVMDASDHMTGHLTTVPQFFFGTVYAEGFDGQPVIHYYEHTPANEHETGLKLRGVCYRAVARIDLEVPNANHTCVGLMNRHLKWISLIADNVGSEARVNDYADFDTPTKHFGGDAAKFTSIAYDGSVNGKSKVTLSAWVLPGIMHLSLKGHCNYETISGSHEGVIKSYDLSMGGTATGVIAPIAFEDKYYIRKNHKYVLRFNEADGYTVNHILDI